MRDGEIIVFDPLGELQKIASELEQRREEEDKDVSAQADQVY